MIKGLKYKIKKEEIIMGRTSRNNMRNSSFFHIMVQGINKEYIFETKKNKEKYLKSIYNNTKDIQIIAYCIMDNHVHILIQSEKIQDIQDWMKRSNTSYAIYYNRVNDRVGYVFRERYKAQPIKNEKHLYLAIEYIHNNPVKAGICNRKEKYPFSSYTKIYQANLAQIQNRMEEILNLCSLQKENGNKEQTEKFLLLEDEKENKEEICQKIIQNFLSDKKLSIEELKNEKQILKEMVKILKCKNKISYRLMERKLKISRETLRRLNRE